MILKKMACLKKTSLFFLKKNKRNGNRDYYIVQQNETMYDVAQKNGIVLQSLYDYNKISATDNIYPGTKILLRPGIDNQVASRMSAINRYVNHSARGN